MESLIFPLSIKEAEKGNLEYSSASNYSAKFPTRLRELHKDAGTTQQKIADAVGVTKSSIGLYETGDSVPDAKTIYKLSKYYEVSTDYLLCLSDVKTTETDLRAVCEYSGLSDETVSTLHNELDRGSSLLQIFINTFVNSVDCFLFEVSLLELLTLCDKASKIDISSPSLLTELAELEREVSNKSHHVYYVQPIQEQIEQVYSKTVSYLGSIVDKMTDCNNAKEIANEKWQTLLRTARRPDAARALKGLIDGGKGNAET